MGERSGETARERPKPRAQPAADKAPEKREKPRAPQTKVQEKKKEPIEHNRAIIHKACTPILEPGKHPSKISAKIPPKAVPRVEPKMQPRAPPKIPPKVISRAEPKKEPGQMLPRQEPKSDAAQKEALRKRKGMFVKIVEEQSRKGEMKNNPILPPEKCEEILKSWKELDETLKELAEKRKSELMVKTTSKYVESKPISDIQLDFKKCKKCNRNLPIDKFERYGGDRGIKPGLQSYRSVCQECRRSDNRYNRLISRNILKTRAINEVFGAYCYDCGIGLEVLPAFEFDHHDSSIKDLSWCDGKFHTLDEILEWKNKENIELRCANCHTERHASNFSKYRDLIMKPDLFRMKPEEINNFLLDNIREMKVSKNDTNEIRQSKSVIETWIRKRFIIESLYGGKCCGCGLDINNLPALEFHHIDPTLKDTVIKWNYIANDNDAMGILLKEECICLCGNCHSLVESKYLDSWAIISQNAGLSARESASIESIARKRLENIDQFIKEYIVKLPFLKKEYEEGKLRMPLKLDFEFGENHIKILVKINHFTELRDNSFYIPILADAFKIKPNYFNREFQKLIDLGYISTNDDERTFQKSYYITDSGFRLIEQYKKDNPDAFLRVKEEVINPEFDYDPSKNIVGDQNRMRVYSNLIFNHINSKGYNEFILREMDDVFGKSNSNLRHRVENYLIPDGIIEVVEHPVYYNLEGIHKAYRLTEKGIKLSLHEEINKNIPIRFNEPNFALIKDKQLMMMLNVFNTFSNNTFKIQDYHQRIKLSESFSTIKDEFFRYFRFNHYLENVPTPQSHYAHYRMTDNGRKFVKYFLENNKIKHFN